MYLKKTPTSCLDLDPDLFSRMVRTRAIGWSDGHIGELAIETPSNGEFLDVFSHWEAPIYTTYVYQFPIWTSILSDTPDKCPILFLNFIVQQNALKWK